MLRKNRKIPVIVGSLATIALLSVGFASWVVSVQAKNVSAGTIAITVGETKDNTLVAELLSDPTPDETVKFDADGNVNGTLIKAASASDREDLTFGGTLKVRWADKTKSNGNLLDAFNTLSFVFTAESPAVATTYNNAITNKVIQSPFAALETALNINVADNATATASYSNPSSAKYTITRNLQEHAGYVNFAFTFNFAWGEFFQYANPVNLNDSNKLDNAVSYLTALHDLSTHSFTLTVSTDKVA